MSLTECYQQLAPWICTPLDRANRAYLEAHLELLSEEYIQFLNLFILQHTDQPDEQRKLRIQQQLLGDAQKRGGTVPAVREAYINLFGGLILDLAPWLRAVDERLTLLSHPGPTERIVVACAIQLKDAIERSLASDSVAPEIAAELQYQLGSLFLGSSLEFSRRGFARAIEYYEAAGCIYTFGRYPLQYARTLTALGTVYGHMSTEMSHEYLAKATNCYEAARQVYSTYHVFS